MSVYYIIYGWCYKQAPNMQTKVIYVMPWTATQTLPAGYTIDPPAYAGSGQGLGENVCSAQLSISKCKYTAVSRLTYTSYECLVRYTQLMVKHYTFRLCVFPT